MQKKSLEILVALAWVIGCLGSGCGIGKVAALPTGEVGARRRICPFLQRCSYRLWIWI